MDPKTIVREFWESYQAGDLDATWETYVSPDLVMHPSSGFQLTRQSWLTIEKEMHEAFDDLVVTVIDQIAEGNKVATRWSITGTQKKEFLGTPSSGVRATVTGTVFNIVEAGKITENWAEVSVPRFLATLRGEAGAPRT